MQLQARSSITTDGSQSQSGMMALQLSSLFSSIARIIFILLEIMLEVISTEHDLSPRFIMKKKRLFALCFRGTHCTSATVQSLSSRSEKKFRQKFATNSCLLFLTIGKNLVPICGACRSPTDGSH